MAFLPQDKYLASGTTPLINNWVDPVYKFDSSSFYNWEQDNLPIYDLEDRDNYLWEMAGYPTSGVNGVMLTVSDSGIDNKKVFGSLSGAIEALPNTMRFPVTIEVCVSGQLGDLHLHNKQFEGSGAGIEIINRAFAKVLAGPSTGSVSALNYKMDGGSAYTAGSSITTFSSLDVSNTMTDSSSMGVSCIVWKYAPGGDPSNWWTNFTRAFVQSPEWAVAAAASERTITISTNFADSNGDLLAATPNLFTVSRYTDASVSSDAESPGSTGSLFYPDATQVQRTNISSAVNTGRATGFIYANALQSVSVKDCTGKIYIRGFCVDGGNLATMTAQRTNVGFDIQNSEVVIENCTAARCKNEGMLANNSNVILNRGFMAFRNYELCSVVATLDTKITANPTAGLRAINSNITLSASIDPYKGLPIDSPFSFYRNLIGIDLQNSNLITPRKVRYGTDAAGEDSVDTYGSQTMVLQSFLNNFEGIRATDSLIDIGNKISSFQNRVGIKLNNSVCRVAEISVDHNGKKGLLSNKSQFNYNKNAQFINRGSAGPFYPVTNFAANGQHVNLNSSEFIPTYVSGTPLSMVDVYGRLAFSGNYELSERGDTPEKVTVPAVELTNNSYMNAVASKSILIGADTLVGGTDDNYMQDSSIRGSSFRVVGSSKLELNGTKDDNTFVIGTANWAKNQKSAALYAGDNSTIQVAGPTCIVQTGIDALAEDNSVIGFGPHMRNGIIDVSGWNLVNVNNQTKVELHSTRACLVANRNSVINMHNLGDYHAFWNEKYLDDADYLTAETGVSAFCSGAYMQFYPNPFVDYAGGGGYGTGTDYAARYPAAAAGMNLAGPAIRSFGWLFPRTPTGTPSVSSLSYGGMCVRAVGNSQINATNVRFPTGWGNASGPTYDLSGGRGCDLLRIWNIADDSELHASYLSVGNNRAGSVARGHPQDASGTYYGPSAVWVSDSGVGLSGAPSSTANTSSLSIFDSFGLGVDTQGELGYYGKTTHQNVGPFRLFVSPAPISKFLGYPGTSDGNYHPPLNPAVYRGMGFTFPNTATLEQEGVPYQLFAQGYSTSSDCSATNNQGPNYQNLSAIYEELGFSGYITTLPVGAQQNENVASSFFYTSAMLAHDSASRIWLDESAMNTFANAKNGTLSTSGRKKIFSYYKAITAYPGEGFAPPTLSGGVGLRSVNLFDLDRDL
jgi:hypothetical protein